MYYVDSYIYIGEKLSLHFCLCNRSFVVVTLVIVYIIFDGSPEFFSEMER